MALPIGNAFLMPRIAFLLTLRAMVAVALLHASSMPLRAADTSNDIPCDPFDEIAKGFGSNLILLANEGHIYGSGLLIENCTRIAGAAHTYFDKTRRFEDLSFIKMSDLSRHSLKLDTLSEGPRWQIDDRDDYSTVRVAAPKPCAAVQMFDQNSVSDLQTFMDNEWPVYLLKAKRNHASSANYCVQACRLKKASERHRGLVGHNCPTKPGDSGAPLFIKGKTAIYYIGIHIGSDSAQPGVNVFLPASKALFSRQGR